MTVINTVHPDSSWAFEPAQNTPTTVGVKMPTSAADYLDLYEQITTSDCVMPIEGRDIEQKMKRDLREML